jgi:hypothetical protein
MEAIASLQPPAPVSQRDLLRTTHDFLGYVNDLVVSVLHPLVHLSHKAQVEGFQTGLSQELAVKQLHNAVMSLALRYRTTLSAEAQLRIRGVLRHQVYYGFTRALLVLV